LRDFLENVFRGNNKSGVAHLFVRVVQHSDGRREESQEVFAGERAARIRAGEVRKAWLEEDEEVELTGSIRSKKMVAAFDDRAESFTLTKISDPLTVEMLWRMEKNKVSENE